MYIVTLYPAAKVQWPRHLYFVSSLAEKIAAFEIEPRIELLAEMRVTLEATKTRFLAEGVLQG